MNTLKGQTEITIGPDLARVPPVELPWSRVCHGFGYIMALLKMRDNQSLKKQQLKLLTVLNASFIIFSLL